jgi:hypothetical protein
MAGLDGLNATGCVREGGFEPGATHARTAWISQFEREMSCR